MAITFVQEKKKQKYLVLILALIIFCIFLVIWWGFLREREAVSPTALPSILVPKKVKINWEVLKDPQLQELQAFEEILPFKEVVVEGEVVEKLGRENPFTPY